METVIAKTKKSYMALYIVILALGAVVLLFGTALLISGGKRQMQFGVIFAVIGVVLTAIGIGWTAYFARLPKVYLTFKDGKFRLYNGFEFSPAEIDYCNARGGGFDGELFNFGRLFISVGGTVYKLKFVENAKSVAANINALKTQTQAIEEIQKHIQEKRSAENADMEKENSED